MRNTAPTDAARTRSHRDPRVARVARLRAAARRPARVGRLLRELGRPRPRPAASSCRSPPTRPYINTIPADEQAPYPGSREIERRIKSLIRWNAMAMVVRGQPHEDGIGGHISTFASSATLYEVGFNHFFRGRDDGDDGDLIYFQGHASPGIYARAFLEGRLSAEQLENFRRELQPEAAACRRYPHPWLMPDFWEFPTVSMGLGPDHGDLPGALQPLPGGSRPQAARPTPRSGPSSATARPTSPSRSAPSRWRRARSSTT